MAFSNSRPTRGQRPAFATFDAWGQEVEDKINTLESLSGAATFETVTSNSTLAASNSILLCSAESPFTVTLTSATLLSGQTFHIKKIDPSGNAVTIDPSGAETIDGAASTTLASQYDNLTIASDGSEWWIL